MTTFGAALAGRLRAAREVEADSQRLVRDAHQQRPNSTTFHSNWPSYDRKFVFHRSAAITRSW